MSIRHAAGLLAAVGLLLSGCTSSRDAAGPTTEPVSSAPNLTTGPPRCLPDVGDPELIDVNVPDGPRLSALVAGSGPRGLVLVHGASGEGRCTWERQIPTLVELGFTILAFDHACVADSDCPSGGEVDLVADIGAGVAELRARGAGRIGVIGASLGTAETVVSAGAPDFDVDAVIALSPALPTTDVRPPDAPEPRNAAAAATLADVPVLYVTSEQDRVSQVEDAQALFDATMDERSELIVIPGFAHAQLLVYPPGAGPDTPPSGDVFDRVVAFLDRYV